MSFWKDFEEFKKLNKLLKMEFHLGLNFKAYNEQSNTKKGSYSDFLETMPYLQLFDTMPEFERKFIYTNQYLGRICTEELFQEFLSKLPDLILKTDNNYYSILIYFFSITNKTILKNKFLEFEKIVLNLLTCQTEIKFKSLSSLVFSYLFLVFYLNKGVSFGIIDYFINLYQKATFQDWKQLELDNKLNYGIIIYLVKIFLKNYKRENKFIEISRIYDSIVLEYKFLGDKVYSSIFMDLSNEIKEEFFESYFRKDNLHKLLTDNDHCKIKNILYKINSYRKPITIEGLYSFLYQFETIGRVRAILKVLENLIFFTFQQLNEILENILIKQVNSEANNIYICPLEADGSSSIYQYLASHSNNLKAKYGKKLNFERSIYDVLQKSENMDEIVIIDDCSLSGTQTSNILRELLGIRVVKSHHDVHCDKLDDDLLEKFRISKVNLCFCVGSNYAENILRELISEEKLTHFSIYIGKYLHMTEPGDGNPGNRVFGSNSLIWESSEEREELKEFCRVKGYEALKPLANKKIWPEKRHRESALGYSDLQQVIVFPYSVPKTSLPILWCEGENWKPLFPNT